jgi:hypothetical protein
LTNKLGKKKLGNKLGSKLGKLSKTKISQGQKSAKDTNQPKDKHQPKNSRENLAKQA